MVKRLSILLALVLFALPSCVDKPDPVIPEEPEDPQESQEQQEQQEPEKPRDKDVTLMGEFSEEFSGLESEFFDFGYKTEGDDFRFYSGFPSMTENGNTVLMLRFDISDASGTGAVITSRNYTYYGTYSIRLRIPDIAAVQPKLGACVDFALFDDDKVFGVDDISLSLRPADQKGVYTSFSHSSPEGGTPLVVSGYEVPGLSGFNPASKFFIYGLDWSEDKISWWCRARQSEDKTILAEITENVPTQPLRLQLRFYHSKQHPAHDNESSTQAPNYPYELEADWIKYTPTQP